MARSWKEQIQRTRTMSYKNEKINICRCSQKKKHSTPVWLTPDLTPFCLSPKGESELEADWFTLRNRSSDSPIVPAILVAPLESWSRPMTEKSVMNLRTSELVRMSSRRERRCLKAKVELNENKKGAQTLTHHYLPDWFLREQPPPTQGSQYLVYDTWSLGKVRWHFCLELKPWPF